MLEDASDASVPLYKYGSILHTVPPYFPMYALCTGGVSVIVRDELDFSVPEAATRASEAEARFTEEQAAIYDTLVEAARAGKPRRVFIQAAGGCGKTMLINAVLDKVSAI